ncbi:MAG TPA: dipeptidase [Gammaproteobacteria bacterium]|nr:dipeptidase [Gammaproteobacteria bacterium]
MFILKKLIVTASAILVVFSALLTLSSTATANLDRQQINQIVDSLDSANFVGFSDFLEQLTTSSIADAATRDIVRSYTSDQPLELGQSSTLYRLLGIYTRLQYGEEAIETLKQLVAIPTFEVEGVEQHENPNFLRFAEVLKGIANDFDLNFRNIDQRVYEITLEGSSEELVAFHAHADIVPVNSDLWVLPDGTHLDPFEVTQIGDRLYGRGTQDDKNGIVASLYAMKVIQEEGLSLLRNIRLLVDTTEETSSTAIPYYFENNPLPNFNIALDGNYPVVIAEKGYGTVMASFPIREGSGEGAEILSISGGLATNQIPAASVARIQSSRPNQLVSQLNEYGALYIASNGGDFAIEAVAENSAVVLRITGISAHSSEPETGVNPVSRMLGFLHNLKQEGIFQDNHITDAASYASVNWGLDYLGNTLDIAYADDFMGPLTTSLTFINLDQARLRLAVNLRLPIGREPEQLIAQISEKLDAWVNSSNTNVTFDYSVGAPMYRNPEGAWVNALLDIATQTLEMPREFGSSAGGTSIHNLPNGVQFGLAMPDLKYTGHNANEFKTVDQFLIDLQIVTEVFTRIGRMPKL